MRKRYYETLKVRVKRSANVNRIKKIQNSKHDCLVEDST